MKGHVPLDLVLRHFAEISAGASSARGRGNTGVVDSMRKSLRKFPINKFKDSIKTEAQFHRFLDEFTDKVISQLPKTARHWGIARKHVNIFLRLLAMSHQVMPFLGNDQKWVEWLEVPLDSYTAKHIIHHSRSQGLRWSTIKGLDRNTSDNFQKLARELARTPNKVTARVYLDLVYWRQPVPSKKT